MLSSFELRGHGVLPTSLCELIPLPLPHTEGHTGWLMGLMVVTHRDICWAYYLKINIQATANISLGGMTFLTKAPIPGLAWQPIPSLGSQWGI